MEGRRNHRGKGPWSMEEDPIQSPMEGVVCYTQYIETRKKHACPRINPEVPQ
jgi:hypothetical protein